MGATRLYQQISSNVQNSNKRSQKERKQYIYIVRAKYKTKAMWRIINKEARKSLQYNKKTELINGTEIISNPQNVLDMLKSSCVRIIGELLNQNGCHVNVQISQQ